MVNVSDFTQDTRSCAWFLTDAHGIGPRLKRAYWPQASALIVTDWDGLLFLANGGSGEDMRTTSRDKASGQNASIADPE
jgi:hypothetical protein